MFTGIVEAIGLVTDIVQKGENIDMEIQSVISNELKIDQSLAHNGVCLTVIWQESDRHRVTAISETLRKSNIGELRLGSEVNLERCLRLSDRIDGHLVQGHVDTKATVISIVSEGGSWMFWFEIDPAFSQLIVSKGSICVNGVSLTLVNVRKESFSTAVIPYTYEHTVFRNLRIGNSVNIEFDILGKYVERHLTLRSWSI